MKLLFQSLLVFCLFLPAFSSHASNGVGPVSLLPGEGPKITITVEIGKKSLNCLGFGICHIKLSANYESVNTSDTQARGTISNVGGKVQIDLPRSGMTDACYNTYFASGKFTLEESFQLPADVAQKVGLPNYTLKAGQYTVTTAESATNVLTLKF